MCGSLKLYHEIEENLIGLKTIPLVFLDVI
jgi:hypothetical protein